MWHLLDLLGASAGGSLITESGSMRWQVAACLDDAPCTVLLLCLLQYRRTLFTSKRMLLATLLDLDNATKGMCSGLSFPQTFTASDELLLLSCYLSCLCQVCKIT
jgi:hypothetical protein